MKGLTEIFSEALQISENQRREFLDEACGEDPDLRRVGFRITLLGGERRRGEE